MRANAGIVRTGCCAETIRNDHGRGKACLAPTKMACIMTYNPDIHHRRSIRLQHYDYARTGAYFVTICAWRRLCVFGTIEDNNMRSNALGDIVNICWQNISDHFPNVSVDAFVVMPNHIHGILVFDDAPPRRGKACLAPTTNDIISRQLRFGAPLPGSLSSVVGSFKSAVSRLINKTRNSPGMPVWQRNYYEHVIRNEDDLNSIREYITYNPSRWADDEEHPEKRTER